MKLSDAVVGFAMTGSFCTFAQSLECLVALREKCREIIPIMSFNAASIDTRFGKAEDFRKQIEEICGRTIINSIGEAEPIGPKKLLDILLILPCTGNTLTKISLGITDTPVTLAAKAHLRNERPLLIGVSTNDALSGSAKNIGLLLNAKNIYFIPMAQDNPEKKPRSVVAIFSMMIPALESSLEGKQIQPILWK
ncbi:MAG TPA: dipicolinate synthase subunit B [Oscillospiraceae bacterium]|nr:dipicolinate synthase subunit B [Oscillospiraceae bacterium]HPF56328.1 dipicolinate synthase subunit B [Clostridiales bacterium]HPK36452.1 dipicolinate synthase subunit B [Oscillospiraceae bacterium]HPR76419.1 dipicolinate synthase subunit B [Oscillospiraceae bacterium]